MFIKPDKGSLHTF